MCRNYDYYWPMVFIITIVVNTRATHVIVAGLIYLNVLCTVSEKKSI